MFGKLFGKQSSKEESEFTSRRVKVGWPFKDDLATVVWDEPKPVNPHLRIVKNPDGTMHLTNIDGPMSTVRPSGL